MEQSENIRTKKEGVKRKKQPEKGLRNEDRKVLKGVLGRLYEKLTPLPLLFR
jgi:hypothetical protein